MKNSHFKFTIKLLAVVLSILMFVYAVPSVVFATAAEAIGDFLSSEETKTSEATTEPLPEQEHVYEEIDLREENVKHFRLDDGSCVAAQYALPVHTLDADGKWQDIDNTISDTGSEYSTGNARVKFAKKTTGNGTLFTIHDGNYKVSLSLDGANKKVVGQVVNNSDENGDLTELQKQMSLEKLSSKIVYTEILGGVDLEYIVNSLNVKENIIVKEKQDSYIYSFTLSLNNLSAALLEDGSINIFDPDTLARVYTIPAPTVFDTDGAYADADVAEYTLIAHGNSKYTLAVSVSSEWMNSSERAFPVTIDPAIYTTTANVSDTYINSNSASSSSSFESNSSMTVGRLYTSGECIAYWKTSVLPTIPNNAYITSAELSLYLSSLNKGADILSKTFGAYAVTSDRDLSHTWVEFSNGSGDIGDLYYFTKLTSDSVGKHVVFDLTELTNKWLSGDVVNYGIAIRQMDSDYGTASFYSSEADECIPYYTINYRIQDGLESYWTYLSQSVDGAGTGYINVATGSLVFAIDTLATTDGLFGFSPSLVYNSTKAGEYNTNIYNNNTPFKYSSAGLGWRLSINETLVWGSYRDAEGDLNFYYIWTDSDGTEHAFYPKNDGSGEYQDEDGLLMTLRSTDEGFTIEDSAHNIRTFRPYAASSDIGSGAVLEKITDKFGNELNFTLNSYGRVTAIGVTPNGSATIPYLTLIYNTSGCIAQIKNAATSHQMRFDYSTTPNGSADILNGGYLRKVTYSYNGTQTLWTAEYNYNDSGMLISAVNTTSNLGIHYEVNSVTKRVGVAYETSDGNNGQRISFIYGTDYTQVRSSGSDDVFATDDDIMTNYVFDRHGRTISSYSTNVNGTEIYGASTGTYSEEATNRIKSSAVSGGSAVNYLVNSNFEMSENEYRYDWTMTDNFSITGGTNYTNVAKLSVKATTTDEILQCVSLKNGTYTLSMDMFTKNCKNVSAILRVESFSNSNHIYEKEIPVSEVSVDGKLTPNLTFTVDTDDSYENFKIRVIITGGASVTSTASVEIDNVMLEKSIGSSSCSAINLGGFESSSIMIYQDHDWVLSDAWTVNGSGVELGVPCGIDGNGVKIYGTAATEKSVSQTVNILPESLWGNSTGAPTSTPANFYLFSGFAKSFDQASGGFFGFRVKVKAFSGGEIVSLFPCVDGVEYTQFVSGLITVPANFFVKEITVECVYENTGAAYFDNVSLVPITDESAAEYEYTTDGRTKASITPKNRTYYKYNEHGDVILEATEDGYIAIYKYNDNHSLNNTQTGTVNYPADFYFDSLFRDKRTEGTDEEETTAATEPAEEEDPFTDTTITIKTSYTYDTYGLVTMTKTYAPSDTQKQTRTSSTYDTTAGSKSFGKQLTYTDENGDMSKYVYYSDGSIQCQISPNGTGLHYTYDIFGRLTEVVPSVYSPSVNTYYGAYGEEDVEYLYNTLNQLSGITTATTAYSFTYDNFGNTTSIKAGDHTLVTYTYNNYNGKMSSMTYGNGTVVTYVYDTLDRLEKVCYNGTVRYEYQYTSDGKLHCVNDYQSGVGYLYGYNVEGKLSEYTEYDLDDMTNELAIAYRYNERGQIEQVSTSLDYASFYNATSTIHLTEYYAYDDVDPMTFLLEEYSITSDARLLAGTYAPSNFTITFEYDGLQRLTKKTTNLDGLFDFTHNVTYTYSDRNSGKLLSSQVSTYTTEVGNNAEKVYGYTYDSNGNITKITENGTTIIQYTYDNLGQLIREDDLSKNLYYVYAYDNNGNRTSKTTYNYTTGAYVSLGTYAYGDDSWGDLLTMYNGMSITYDTIGNPLSYFNGTRYTFTWTDGRRLTSAVKKNALGGTMGSYSFTYNDEGIRTSKTSDGVTHYYTLDGTRIVSEAWGDYFAVYIYDESGSPIGMHIRQNWTTANEFYTYYFEKNLQGDIIGVYNSGGTLVYSYAYDAWGNFTATSHSTTDTFASYNPFRYRGYYYDSDLGFYYLNSRYYDPITGRFLNADGQLNDGLLGYNQFAYCENNPVNRVDPNGNAWWHWAIAAAVVVACAAATVVTCGGFAAAASAVALVAGGTAAATTSATIAAGALIGSSMFLATAGMASVMQSSSVQEFMDSGNWGTVVGTVGGAAFGGYGGYTMSKAQTPASTPTGKGTQNPKVQAAIQKGQAMHKQMDYGPGVLKEQTIAPGCRVDGIDFNNRIIYELKPNNPQAIARGMNQLSRYTSAASQQFGGTWTGVLKLYD